LAIHPGGALVDVEEETVEPEIAEEVKVEDVVGVMGCNKDVNLLLQRYTKRSAQIQLLAQLLHQVRALGHVLD